MGMSTRLTGRFVSLNTEMWGGDRPGRRDTINVLDETDGKVYGLNPPRNTGGNSLELAPVVRDAGSFGFGVEVSCDVEQRSFPSKDGRVNTIYILHAIESVKVPAKSAG